jgi:uncharacterized protein (UPF0332 family)
MSFNWSNFLTLATTLVNVSNESEVAEAALRSAMSRAYYAAFCAARNFLYERGELSPTRTGQDHGRVKDHFKNSNHKAMQQIGYWLERLFEKRVQADYENTFPGNLTSEAQFSIISAEKVLNRLAQL